MALFTFPAQAVSIPGAATEATLLLVEQNTADTVTELQTLNTAFSSEDFATQTTLSALNTKVPSGLTVTSSRLEVDGSGVTQPVSAVSLPLPTGASTSANQVTANASLASIDSKLTSPLAVTGPLTDAELRATAVPVSVSSLPLPTGAATEATLASLDSKFNTLGQKTSANSAPVVLASDQSAIAVTAATLPLPTGAATEATLATRATEATLSTLEGKVPANLTVSATRLLVDGSGVTQPVSASSLPLPTGAATEATLTSIDSSLNLNIVDQIDTTPLLDVSVTNIPASAGSPVEIVASTASEIKKIITVEDIGEFIGLYTGGVGVEVLKCILPLGGGEVELQISAGTRISLRHMKNSAITSGFIAVNFLG